MPLSVNGRKICSKCGIEKSINDFYRNNHYKRTEKLTSNCKTCVNAQGNKYRKNNRDKVNAQSRKWKKANPDKSKNQYLKHNFGITINDYNKMVEKQNNLCAICNQAEKYLHQNGKIRALAVDHCHKTGKIRELLCFDCNTVIGKMKEDPNLLLKAIEYLNKHN